MSYGTAMLYQVLKAIVGRKEPQVLPPDRAADLGYEPLPDFVARKLERQAEIDRLFPSKYERGVANGPPATQSPIVAGETRSQG